ncbi:MAG: RNA ligase family protein [Verrucomicrobiota bacterium]
MGYLHIDNLYKDTRVLEFKNIYALEKIHGTSAHITWNGCGGIKFYAGGEKYERFVALFDVDELVARLPTTTATVYGEAYGGKQQGMRKTYGDELRFVVFDVRIEGSWLSVPQAAAFAQELGLEFVDYALISSDLEVVHAHRDLDSTQAIRNGMGAGHKREGVVLRPPYEVTLNNGARLIAKHKRDDFRETRTPRHLSATELKILVEARAIADEWVTPMRLQHILQKLPDATGIEHTGAVVRMMTEDILREAEGEIVVSRAARKAIGAATARLYKAQVSKI